MKYIAIFHANLNYAYLTPERYEFVIRSSYELIFDTMKERFPDTRFVFEASGYTLEQIAACTPDVLEKLKDACASGRCEFMGSPYAHPMLPNFPCEDGIKSIEFSNRVYERILGFTPRSFWNPECGWRGYVPDQVIKTGYSNLIADFEAYSRSCDSSGTPIRPEIYEKEKTDKAVFYNFGFNYDLPGTERAVHFPFRWEAGKGRELRILLRTDRVAQFGVRYFMGMEGYSFEEYLGLIRKYSEQPPGEPEGALIIFADDAEYIGTNGWFRLKYQNKPDNVFEHTPRSREKLIELIGACEKLGGFTTFDAACRELPVLEETFATDDDAAWHGARASTWASTPMARLLRPWQDLVRRRIHELEGEAHPELIEAAWFHLTNSFNSDGQWPPTMPESPHIVHPFNYRYNFDNLLTAEMLVGGVDRGSLPANPVETIKAVLEPQQELVLEKARELCASKNPEEAADGEYALRSIERARDYDSIVRTATPLLYPSEYGIRADALVAARRRVGGVEIEKAE